MTYKTTSWLDRDGYVYCVDVKAALEPGYPASWEDPGMQPHFYDHEAVITELADCDEGLNLDDAPLRVGQGIDDFTDTEQQVWDNDLGDVETKKGER